MSPPSYKVPGALSNSINLLEFSGFGIGRCCEIGLPLSLGNFGPSVNATLTRSHEEVFPCHERGVNLTFTCVLRRCPIESHHNTQPPNSNS
jgi:hypothetical protein